MKQIVIKVDNAQNRNYINNSYSINIHYQYEFQLLLLIKRESRYWNWIKGF